MRICSFYFITFFFFLSVSYAQKEHGGIPKSKIKEITSFNNIFSSSTDSVSKNKRADIKKYLILNAIYDSIYSK